MKWVNATLGIVEHPPAITIADDKKSLDGLLYARVFNGFYSSAKVNLEIIPITGDFGRCDVGGVNHTGAYKTLLINETNLGTILLDNLQCDDLREISVGPLQLDHEQVLASLRDHKSSGDDPQTADFTEIFKNISLEIYFLYFVTFVVIFYLYQKFGVKEEKRKERKRRREKRKFSQWAFNGNNLGIPGVIGENDGSRLGSIWEEGGNEGNLNVEGSVKEVTGSAEGVSNANQIEEVPAVSIKRERKGSKKRKKLNSPQVGWNLLLITFLQFNSSPKLSRLRLIILIYFLTVFWIFQFLFASFTAELSTSKTIEFIDSLDDLAESNTHFACFIEEYNAWRRFQSSKEEIPSKIWSKAIQKHGMKGTVVKVKKSTKIMELLEDNRVGITVRAATKMLNLMQCLKYDPEENANFRNFKTVHQATDPSLNSIRLMIAFGPSIENDAKERLTWAYMIFQENGLASYYQKNPQGLLNLLTSEQRQCVMAVDQFVSENGRTTEEDPKPLKPSNFKSFTWMCTSIMASGLIALIYEGRKNILKYYLSRKNI